MDAECLVFTFKEGLLSPMAHDLQLRVGRCTVEVADLRVDARFDAASLRVVTAMADGRPRAGGLDDGDRRKIERNIAEDVLEARRFPEIRFTSTEVTPEGEGYRVRGDLALHGRTRSIQFQTHRTDEGKQMAEVTIHQPDYGIKPYSAMFGTLKIKADVTVRVTL